MDEKIFKMNKSILFEQNNNEKQDLFQQYKAPKIILTQINQEILNQKKQQKKQQKKPQSSSQSSIQYEKEQHIKQVFINTQNSNTNVQTKRLRLNAIRLQGQLRRAKQQNQSIVEQKSFLNVQAKKLKRQIFQIKKENEILNKRVRELEWNIEQQVQLSEKENFQNKIRHLEVQKSQLQVKNAYLGVKQQKLMELEIQHQALTYKCNNLIQTNRQYQQQFEKLKRYIHQFQDSFYRRKEKKVLKPQICQFLSETQVKMERIQKMISQFQLNYYREQVKLLQRQMTQIGIEYGKLAKEKAQNINKKVQISEEVRQNLIKQCKKHLEQEQKGKLKVLNKRFVEYKNKIHHKKMANTTKMIKQRVTDIQTKMFSLSHSQFIQNKQFVKLSKNLSDQSEPNQQNAQIVKLKETLKSKQSQLHYLKKVATNTLFQSKQGPEQYTIKLSLDKQSGLKQSYKQGSESVIGLGLGFPYKYGTSVYRNQPNIVKAQTYDDGTKVPQKQQLKLMLMEIETSRKKVAMYLNQRKQLSQQVSKLFSKNQKLYEELQNQKRNSQQTVRKLEQFKNSRYAKIQRLQAELQAQNIYYLQQLADKKQKIGCLQMQLSALQDRCSIANRNETTLFIEVKRLQKQLSFNNTRQTSEIGVVNIKHISKVQDFKINAINLQQKIQSQAKQLEEYLGQNLKLINNLQSSQLKLNELSQKVRNQAVFISDRQHELIVVKNNNLIKQTNLKNSIAVLQKRLSKCEKEQQQQKNYITQYKEQIKTLKRSNKKLSRNLQSLKQDSQMIIQKWEKKYKKLQKKYFGLQVSSSSKSKNQKVKEEQSQIKSIKVQKDIVIYDYIDMLDHTSKLSNASEKSYVKKSQQSFKMSEFSLDQSLFFYVSRRQVWIRS